MEIPQYLIYAIFTALFYFMVARPFQLRPILGKANSARHSIIVWAVLIVLVLFAMAHWAEIVIVEGQRPFSKGAFIALGQDLLFGIVFSIIVWRSRSILWAAFLHCMADFRPYYWSPGRPWMLDLHIPSLQIGYIQIYLMGLVGAEIIRFYTNLTTPNTRRREIVDNL